MPSVADTFGLDSYTKQTLNLDSNTALQGGPLTLSNPNASVGQQMGATYNAGSTGGSGGGGSGGDVKFTDQSYPYQFFHNADGTINWGRTGLAGAGAGIGALYASGALNPVPKKVMTLGSNTEVPYVESTTPFYVQNPQTGQVSLQQRNPSIEAYNIANPRPGTTNIGPYQAQIQKYAQGGLAHFNHFRDGGINYLPSKTVMDEDNPQNYVRANGYVADSMQAGNKDEDTMLAQLADGEFVTRTDGVLGAGILAGADPTNQNEMRKLGADFFYEQQKRFKRIFDLLDASRKATAH